MQSLLSALSLTRRPICLFGTVCTFHRLIYAHLHIILHIEYGLINGHASAVRVLIGHVEKTIGSGMGHLAEAGARLLVLSNGHAFAFSVRHCVFFL